MTEQVTPIGRIWQTTPSRRVLPPLEAKPTWVPWLRRLDAERREIVVGNRTGGDPTHVVSVTGPDASAQWALFEGVNGTRTLGELAQHAGLAAQTAQESFAALYAAGITSLEGDVLIDAELFTRHACALVQHLDTENGESPVFRAMWDGTASKRLVVGYCLEVYFFAHTAPSHISLAIASAPTDRLKMAFSEFLASEYWHSAWLKRGLIAGGLSDADIERADPLPENLAAINFLRWAASQDPLLYAMCLALGEGNAAQATMRDRFWRRVQEQLPQFEDIVAPFREHELLDCAETHENFGYEPLREHGALHAAERARLRRRFLYYARMASYKSRAIHAYYGGESGPSTFSSESWTSP